MTWLRCSDGRSCGEGFECIENLCEPYVAPSDGGRGNILKNPNFDEQFADGGFRAWRGYNTVTLTPVTNGGRRGMGASVTRSTTSLPAAVTSSVHVVPRGSRWCASVWVRSELHAPRRVHLVIADVALDGGMANIPSTPHGFDDAEAEWHSVVTKSPVTVSGPAIQVRYWPTELTQNSSPYFTDDASLFEVGADAGCPWQNP